DRADLVAAARVAAGAGAEHGDRRGGGQDDDEGGDALHGPGRTRLGSHCRSPPLSRHGAEPSSAACEAPPGQRATKPVCRPARRSFGGIDVSWPPVGVSRNWKALKIGWMRA